jgi:hypothetical protein
MPKYIYRFGKCEECGEFKALENNVCGKCHANNNKLPDFLKDLFKGKNNDTKRD